MTNQIGPDDHDFADQLRDRTRDCAMNTIPVPPRVFSRRNLAVAVLEIDDSTKTSHQNRPFFIMVT